MLTYKQAVAKGKAAVSIFEARTMRAFLVVSFWFVVARSAATEEGVKLGDVEKDLGLSRGDASRAKIVGEHLFRDREERTMLASDGEALESAIDTIAKRFASIGDILADAGHNQKGSKGKGSKGKGSKGKGSKGKGSKGDEEKGSPINLDPNTAEGLSTLCVTLAGALKASAPPEALKKSASALDILGEALQTAKIRLEEHLKANKPKAKAKTTTPKAKANKPKAKRKTAKK